MAQIILDIPNASLARVVDGMCGALGYEQYVEDGGNMTKNQYAKQQLINYIKITVKTYEQQQATRTSNATIDGQIEGINIA